MPGYFVNFLVGMFPVAHSANSVGLDLLGDYYRHRTDFPAGLDYFANS